MRRKAGNACERVSSPAQSTLQEQRLELTPITNEAKLPITINGTAIVAAAIAEELADLKDEPAWKDAQAQIREQLAVATAECDELRAALAEAQAEVKPPRRELSEEGLREFSAWLAREVPPGTVISDPAWWAPRIVAAVLRAAGEVSCWCESCDIAKHGRPSRMSTCPQCGSKRCPRAIHHDRKCAATGGER